MSHPRHRLNRLIHQPIVAALVAAKELEFAFIRDAVEISDSVLSRQISMLHDAGYVTGRKGHVGTRPRTWLSLTHAGRTAYDDHLDALDELVRDASTSRRPQAPSLPHGQRSADPT